MENIKVTYIVDNDTMSDEEYENQEEKEFIITKQMIEDFVMEQDARISPMNETIEIESIKIIK
jgi:hypothetical protein